jgi:hypothetical protein
MFKIKLCSFINTSDYANCQISTVHFQPYTIHQKHRFDWEYMTVSTNLSCCCLCTRDLYTYCSYFLWSVSQVRVCIEYYYSNDVYVWRLFCMEISASSGRKKRLFHRKSIAKNNVIEHVLLDANSYLTYRSYQNVYFVVLMPLMVICTYIPQFNVIIAAVLDILIFNVDPSLDATNVVSIIVLIHEIF